jgi:hypothetical protein
MFGGKFLHGLKQQFNQGRLEFHGEAVALAQAARFGEQLRLAASSKWVICQTAFCRAAPGAGISLALHASSGHQQWAIEVSE